MTDNPYKNIPDPQQKATSQRNFNVVDDIIHNAIENGEFDELPGVGKPLQLEDESHIPSELRLAHRLLKQNDMTPEWIALGKSIDTMLEDTLTTLRDEYRAYRGRLGDAIRSDIPEVRHAEAEQLWASAQTHFRSAITRINAQLLNYNLKLPSGFPRRALVSPDGEFKRVTSR